MGAPRQDAPLGSCLALWLKLCSGGGEAEMPEDGRLEFTLAELQQTMEAVVKRGRLRTLLLGLQLFQPVSFCCDRKASPCCFRVCV